MAQETEAARDAAAVHGRPAVRLAGAPAGGRGGSPAGPAFDEQVLEAELRRLARTPIASTDKGFTGLAPLTPEDPLTPEELSTRRPALAGLGLLTPYVLLRSTALEGNLAAMAAYCSEHGVVLAPHAKTTMSPEVWAAHLRHGAWALTAATPHQVEVLRAVGVRRIVLANEVADASAARWLVSMLDADPGLELCCYVDDLVGVAALDGALGPRSGHRRLPVLVEVGYPGGRGGARGVAKALEVARAARASGNLSLIGAAGFEGLIGNGAGTPDTLDSVRRFVAVLREVGEALLSEGLVEGSIAGTGPAGPLVLSAGGSCFFDVIVEELAEGWPEGDRPLVVLRSGGYACHDHGQLARLSPFVRGTAPGGAEPALEVWCRVIARPEPGLALLDAGRRDLSTDADLPVVIACRGGTGGLRVVACNDQHTYVSLADPAALALGDLVALGISHCCTTFDKWRVIPMVDAESRVVGVAHTFF